MANFGFLLGYLYSGSVLVDIPVNENDSEEAFAKAAQRLAKLYCVGAAYEMDELMSFVIKKLKEAKLWEKMPGMDFFELSEKLYPEETEAAATDEYAKFFAQVYIVLAWCLDHKSLSDVPFCIACASHDKDRS